MILTADKLKELALGAEDITESEKGIEFSRFNKAERDLYLASTLESRTHTPAGVQLYFKTDAEAVNICVEAENCLDRSFFCIDVICNGELAGCIRNFDENHMVGFYSWDKYPLGEYSETVELGKGEKEVKIQLPWSVRTYIKEIDLVGASYAEGIKKEKSIILYGDSITHGYDSIHPSNAYSVRLAEALGYECVIKAVGGECFLPELASVKQVRKPEIVTVAYGTNDWSSRNKERFDKNSRDFIKRLRENYPESKIFVLSPIWRKDNITPNKTGTDFDDIHYIEKALRSVCLQVGNVNFIRGWDFIPQDENLYGDLRLHPNDKGFLCYADSLFREISDKI